MTHEKRSSDLPPWRWYVSLTPMVLGLILYAVLSLIKALTEKGLRVLDPDHGLLKRVIEWGWKR